MALASATRVGPYEILSVLGGGAMGEVYRARDTRLDRTIALKVISEETLADTSRRRRFVQEARSASSLNHPNIVVVHDFGTHDGISYIASELVEGQSLREVIRQGAMPMPQLLDIAIQIADGLAAAHQTGIVHRDLKPENIMLTPDGRVKILDFGLAKPIIDYDGDSATMETSATLSARVTEPGLIVGTVGYMSPEQARGTPVGFASDQFSFGLLLHEMATGQPAFRRETPMQTLLAIANAEHAPFTPGPVAFRLLVERCLRPEPEKRFAETREIAERLRKIRSELPLRPTPVPSRVQRAAERIPTVVHEVPREWIAIAVASFATLALLVFVLARLFGYKPPDLKDLTFTPLSADGVDAAFPAIDPSGKVLAWSGDVNGALQIMTRSRNSGSASQLTRMKWDCLFPFWSPDGQRVFFTSGPRNAPALYSVPASGGEPELAFENVRRAAVSPDGRTFELLRPEQGGETLSLWYATGAGSAPVRQGNIRLHGDAALAWSADGRRLGFWGTMLGGPSGLFTIAPRGTVPRLDLRMSGEPRPFAWLGDKQRVVFSDSVSAPQPHLWIADPGTGKASQLTSGAGRETLPESAGGGDVAFESLSESESLMRVSLPTGAAQEVGAGASPAWSPAGKQYAYVTGINGAEQIRMHDTGSQWEHTLLNATQLPGRTWALRDIALAPDGTRAAFTRIGPDGIHVFLTSLGGLPPLRLTNAFSSDRQPSWSADGKWVIFVGSKNGREMVMARQAGSSDPPMRVVDGPADNPVVSPDGASVAFIGPDGALNIVASAGGPPRRYGDQEWVRLAWADTREIIGARRSSENHLKLARVNVATGAQTPVADLGVWPAVAGAMASPVSGLSVAPDGSAALVGVSRMHAAVWLLQGLR